ncbi:MAG: hypothetical protein GC136_00325 [Alphaproteobacteria bacterium]|nr:hypothetical protein [Alphaproteobacteria bacterium]
MGELLPISVDALNDWFVQRLNVPLEIVAQQKPLFKVNGDPEDSFALEVNLYEDEREVLFRFQRYDLDEKCLRMGDIVLLDKSYAGLGTILQYEVENFFIENFGFTKSFISASSKGGSYIWISYGYLPTDAEIPKLQKALHESFKSFSTTIENYGGQIPDSFKDKTKSLIEKLAEDKSALRDIAKLQLAVTDMFVSACPADPACSLKDLFDEKSRRAAFLNRMKSEGIIDKSGLFNVARRILTTCGLGYGAVLDFSDTEAMALRAETVARARIRFAESMRLKTESLMEAAPCPVSP